MRMAALALARDAERVQGNATAEVAHARLVELLLGRAA
jgi:hypothetical protein